MILVIGLHSIVYELGFLLTKIRPGSWIAFMEV